MFEAEILFIGIESIMLFFYAMFKGRKASSYMSDRLTVDFKFF